jgi:hypothetical protein
VRKRLFKTRLTFGTRFGVVAIFGVCLLALEFCRMWLYNWSISCPLLVLIL